MNDVIYVHICQLATLIYTLGEVGVYSTYVKTHTSEVVKQLS